MSLLTPEQAAAHISVGEKTLRALRQQGLIPYVAVTARKKLYRLEDLDAFVAARVTTEIHQPTERRGRGRGGLSRPTNVVSFTARREERRSARAG